MTLDLDVRAAEKKWIKSGKDRNNTNLNIILRNRLIFYKMDNSLLVKYQKRIIFLHSHLAWVKTSLNDSGTAKIKEVFFCLRIAITQKNLETEKNKKKWNGEDERKQPSL